MHFAKTSGGAIEIPSGISTPPRGNKGSATARLFGTKLTGKHPNGTTLNIVMDTDLYRPIVMVIFKDGRTEYWELTREQPSQRNPPRWNAKHGSWAVVTEPEGGWQAYAGEEEEQEEQEEQE